MALTPLTPRPGSACRWTSEGHPGGCPLTEEFQQQGHQHGRWRVTYLELHVGLRPPLLSEPICHGREAGSPKDEGEPWGGTFQVVTQALMSTLRPRSGGTLEDAPCSGLHGLANWTTSHRPLPSLLRSRTLTSR